MITFTRENHFNINRIQDKIQAASLITNKDYFIFGLKQEDRPPIKIELNQYSDNYNQLWCMAEKLGCLFVFNNISFNASDNGDIDYGTINIGLRKDIRADIDLSVKILKTIILTYENKLKFKGNSRIPNLNQSFT